MAARAETLSIGAGQESTERVLVESGNFPSYLLPDRAFVRQQNLSPVLDLSLFAPYTREVATFTHSSQLDSSESAPSGRMMRMGDIYVRPLDQRKGRQIEVSRSFFFDPPSQAIRPSQIITGNEEEVGHDLNELVQQGKLPVLSVHRHPINAFPSYDDILPHLEAPYQGTPAPLVKASMIICPDAQILQVSTAETLQTMTDENIDGFLEGWERRFREIKMRQTAELRAALKTRPEDVGLKQAYRDELYKADNHARLELMRSTGLAYYISQDFSHFERFVT